MKFIINTIGDSILHILFFACAFAILGYYIPRCYFTHFDKTNYYRIDSVKIENKVYKEGDKVTAIITREALLSVQAVSIRELTLIDKNKEIEHIKTELALNAGKETVMVDWQLPNELENGVYYFKGVVHYTVRGIEKTTTFQSEDFNIIN